jgi:hypothetical protein
MRSTEFIKEAGRAGDTDDSGMPINRIPTDAEYAARQAQGAKTGAAIKNFFSGTPKELKPAPANFPTIDPIARSNAGYLPATPQEIAAFQAANPYYGKVIGRDGKPIGSGTPGVTWDAGGEQNVLQAAQAAAAGKGNPSQSAAAPAYAGFSPGQSVGPGAADVTLPQTQRNLRDPNSLNQPAQNAQPEITIPQTRRNLRDPNSLNQTEPVPAPAPAAVVPAPVQTAPRVYGPKGEIILPNAAGVNDLDVYKTSELDRYGGETTRKKNDSAPAQNTTPPPAKFNMSPTVWSYAINMGLIQNGKPVESAIRAFQKKNGLEVDGVIGNDTSNAIISAATTGTPNIGRGNQGGATPYEKTLPPMPAETGGPPAGSGTIMPGVKDSKGRQVYKRPDSSVMAWDPTTQLFSFYDAPSVTRGSKSGQDYVNPAQPRATQAATQATTGTAAGTMGDYKSRALPAGTAPPYPAFPPYVGSANASTFDKLRAPFGSGPASISAMRTAQDERYKAYHAAVADWEAKYGKTHYMSGNPKKVQETVVKESSDLARIRHLAGLTRN